MLPLPRAPRPAGRAQRAGPQTTGPTPDAHARARLPRRRSG